MTDTRTYPGSLDNGAIDAEYSPRLSEADAHYATRAEVQALADDMCRDVDAANERIDDHEKELDKLSRSVHALTWLVERLLNTPEGQSRVATEPPRPRAVIYADSVPWESIGHCLSVAIYGAPLQRQTAQAALDWYNTHAPKEAAA
jgi:hypothetical protein